MKKTFATLSATALLAGSFANGADVTLGNLDARMQSLESRLASIEKRVSSISPGHGYSDTALKAATNGSKPKAPEVAYRAQQKYLIKEGDTIGSIAKKFGVDRADLLKANRLSEGQPIYISEPLIIPAVGTPPKGGASVAKKQAAPKGVGSTHTVAKGDTLSAIARRHGVTVAELKAANGLRNDFIQLGQKLIIPKKAAAPQKTASKTAKSAPDTAKNDSGKYRYDNPLLRSDETYGYYTVRNGDNLYALARDFFTNMAELQRLNKKSGSTVIHPGEDIIVPTSKYNAYHKKTSVAQN